MLILARKAGEAIVVDNEITVRVLEIKGGQVKIGVEAPGRVRVHREEVFKKILEENKRAGLEGPVDLAGMDDVLKSSAWKVSKPAGEFLGKVASGSGIVADSLKDGGGGES